MGLDITIKIERPVFCPHCGEVVDWKTVKDVDSCGQAWFNYLESIGYYVSPETMKKTGAKDKYGQDVVLRNDQIKQMEKFLKDNDVYYGYTIYAAIRVAQIDGHSVVINADW